ncbi:hypothetical protein VNO78_02115 [Psophocarpus tetragonolobus]|uniref:RecF/RecN/SMC N-terminal domain-containing protein n=1 Tax=Psophocarpus tetragonolobus TaxID=3891 RepID=A0AAN9T056_PSOTE
MIALLEAQLKAMNPNLDSISEYQKKVALYNEQVEGLNAVTQEWDDIKKQYDEWRKKRFDLAITLGGDVELKLVDSLDPFSESVVFGVRPPKKSWKNIANLSVVERLYKLVVSIFLCVGLHSCTTLSSLALVFALHHYKPTLLYVMDEIDATLDFKNVSIVGHYVKNRTKDAQFIIIRERNRELINEAIHVRYALLPYLYTLFREANSMGVPVVRPLWMEFSFNEATFSNDEAFMRAKHAPVYFPGEQSWYDLRTGAMYKGGVTHKLEVTEEIILLSKELETLLHVVL